MLSTEDLDAMRATFVGSLPDTCEIRRDALASDGRGGQVATPSTIATVACRVSPLTDTIRTAEALVGDRVIAKAPWLGAFPVGTDVTETDRVRLGDREFEVAAVYADRSWEIGRRVLLRLIDGGAG